MNSEQEKQKIGFIGGGNMAQAIITGLLSSGIPAKSIMVSDPVDKIRNILSSKGVLTTIDNNELVSFCDILIIAIKPQLFKSVLLPIRGRLNKQVVISIAAGITIDTISSLLEHNLIVRAMPNTPALIQEGATGLYANSYVSDTDRTKSENILSAVGLVVWVASEENLHAVTAISGSAPAYFFYIMESMVKAGMDLGLDKQQATELTLQTAFGSSKMALENSDETPSDLRKKVTSPNGTTHSAIESFKDNCLESIIAKGMQACVTRSIDMSNND